MWHRIAPELAREYTVVAADLRGYGDSDRPEAGPDHAGYAFRAMAADQVALMEALGFHRFAVVGHDRGARVTHRMALDHPDRVERLALLDILPTAYVFEHVDRRVATRQLPLVLPQPARRSAGAADRRRPALLPAPPARQLGQSGWTRTPPRRCGSTSACSPTPQPAGRCSRTTAPRRRSTSSTTPRVRLRDNGSPRPAWCCGGSGASWPATRRARWRSGASLAADPASMIGGVIAGAGHFLAEENHADTLAALQAFLGGRG